MLFRLVQVLKLTGSRIVQMDLKGVTVGLRLVIIRRINFQLDFYILM